MQPMLVELALACAPAMHPASYTRLTVAVAMAMTVGASSAVGLVMQSVLLDVVGPGVVDVGSHDRCGGLIQPFPVAVGCHDRCDGLIQPCPSRAEPTIAALHRRGEPVEVLCTAVDGGEVFDCGLMQPLPVAAALLK